MSVLLLKNSLRNVVKAYRAYKVHSYINTLVQQRSTDELKYFDFGIFKTEVAGFIHAMQTDGTGVHYRFSDCCSKPTLYASVYACMALSLLGELTLYTDAQRKSWVDYFDSFQHEDDGLFYDPIVINNIYSNADWWGARHLSLHMISAYTDLGARPKNPFYFLRQYYDIKITKAWLDSFDWENGVLDQSNDFDNKLMNIGCLLQYQRDSFNDDSAATTIEFIKEYLHNKINKTTGFWGKNNISNPKDLSRTVQFAYHLLPLFFYDKNYAFNHSLIIENVLKTQNKYGGFGVSVNSSACEDIDSIDILIRLYGFSSETEKTKIEKSLFRAFKWVLCNQTDDGGFAFKLNDELVYGHHQLRSLPNKGGMLPTWFRTLSMAYLSRHFELNERFVITACPGYEF